VPQNDKIVAGNNVVASTSRINADINVVATTSSVNADVNIVATTSNVNTDDNIVATSSSVNADDDIVTITPTDNADDIVDQTERIIVNNAEVSHFGNIIIVDVGKADSKNNIEQPSNVNTKLDEKVSVFLLIYYYHANTRM
jgi:hypothetical protein